MERLDYRINEDGIERWISYEKVATILSFLYPHIWESIEQKMRWDDEPFEYTWGGKRVKIEYKGPSPRKALKVVDTLGILCLLALVLVGSGCRRVDQLLGTEKKADHVHAFNVVSCCEDNDGHDNLSWPSFLPQSHIDLCKRVHTACHANDCQIDGDTWLDMHVDCGHGYGHIGDEYYAGHPGY